MKIPFRAIAALIILSLIGVFTYQAYWLTGLYATMKKDMDNCLKETLQISDYNEMMLRCDSLRNHALISEQIKTNYGLNTKLKSNYSLKIDSLALQNTQSSLLINEPFSTTIDKNGSVELLTKYFQRGIHSHLDTFTEINLKTFDSIFTRSIAMRGIVYLPHRIEIVDLYNDSSIVSRLSNPSGFIPSKKAVYYYYNFDLHNKMAFRLCVEPTYRAVLYQMSGILGTSFLIIVILGISFWYLIRIILRQKTVEEMKEDFTHNITHELKTPIAVAYAANDSLLNFKGVQNLEKRHTYLQIIQEQLKQLSGLVEQILSMSMEQRKHFRLNYEEIPLRSMLENLIYQHKLKANKPVEFQLDVADDLIVRADRTHFYNIVSNLIDNAVKYSKEKAEISIEAFHDNHKLTLKVHDKGIGIATDKQQHLFDKFYRVPTGNLHNVKGYGLGLYYVKIMVEQHKGTVAIESSIGKGSTFIIQIPG